MDEIGCTNLKHWKVSNKKSTGRYIGSTLASRRGWAGCPGERYSWAVDSGGLWVSRPCLGQFLPRDELAQFLFLGVSPIRSEFRTNQNACSTSAIFHAADKGNPNHETRGEATVGPVRPAACKIALACALQINERIHSFTPLLCAHWCLCTAIGFMEKKRFSVLGLIFDV